MPKKKSSTQKTPSPNVTWKRVGNIFFFLSSVSCFAHPQSLQPGRGKQLTTSTDTHTHTQSTGITKKLGGKSVSRETEPGSTHHRDEIPNMNASAVPLPRARHGCLGVGGRRSYLRRSPSRNAKSGAAVSAPRSGSSKRAAEITKQLSLIRLNELSCREGRGR